MQRNQTDFQHINVWPNIVFCTFRFFIHSASRTFWDFFFAFVVVFCLFATPLLHQASFLLYYSQTLWSLPMTTRKFDEHLNVQVSVAVFSLFVSRLFFISLSCFSGRISIWIISVIIATFSNLVLKCLFFSSIENLLTKKNPFDLLTRENNTWSTQCIALIAKFSSSISYFYFFSLIQFAIAEIY